MKPTALLICMKKTYLRLLNMSNLEVDTGVNMLISLREEFKSQNISKCLVTKVQGLMLCVCLFLLLGGVGATLGKITMYLKPFLGFS